MPIAPGDTVALHLVSAAPPTSLAGRSSNPTLLGVVSSVFGAPAVGGTVRWENGETTTQFAINAGATILDRIDGPDPAEVTRLNGREVRRKKGSGTPQQFDSPEYNGIVSRIFKRNPNGDGVGVIQVADVQTQQGLWYEALASDLEVVGGR